MADKPILQFQSRFRNITLGNQDVWYEELFEVIQYNSPVESVHMVRVKIKSNSYAAQCSAEMKRWNGEEWKHVTSILPGGMKTPDKMYCYQGDRWNDPKHFERDVQDLISRATIIFGGQSAGMPTRDPTRKVAR